ncbi:MAG: FAD-dependent oxidoreductase, partial [Caulobacteraceae bacterium]
MSSTASVKRVQVIVAGAGPAGVVAAYRLAQRGIDVLLLEAQPYCLEDMRASTFHPPTIDMMEELGLLNALEAQGLRAPIYQYRNRSTGAVLQLDMGEVADVLKHPYRLQCEQFKLTRLVTGLLKDHPHAEVKFSRRVVHFEQDETGVTVQVEAPNELETYKADYVIAADGANSLIRKYLRTEFEGFTYAEKFLTLSTDTPLEQHFDNLADVNYVADAREWCVLLKVPTLWRVLVPAREDEPDAALLSDEKKTAVFNGLVPDGAAVKTYHRTLYRVHQRVAKKYRHGRVILVGDSAHLNNPLGGFGMNSGVHDVWNLT